nr:ATP synthase F0 subunit 8 [Vesperus sanzi]
MPQMAPLNWLLLMLLFILIFKMFNCLNYYAFIYKTKFMIKKISLKYNWKW